MRYIISSQVNHRTAHKMCNERNTTKQIQSHRCRILKHRKKTTKEMKSLRNNIHTCPLLHLYAKCPVNLKIYIFFVETNKSEAKTM